MKKAMVSDTFGTFLSVKILIKKAGPGLSLVWTNKPPLLSNLYIHLRRAFILILIYFFTVVRVNNIV